jgi:hypothetical protein
MLGAQIFHAIFRSRRQFQRLAASAAQVAFRPKLSVNRVSTR